MKVIDGSMGEGGGQILRSSLSLAAITGTPVRIENIRKRRSKSGLLRQHLTAVRAIAQISGGHLIGDEMRSSEVTFTPEAVRSGTYRFSVGSAGSANLVLQTVLPPLACGSEASEVVIEGGTHNPMAPSYDYLEQVFFPLLRKMGVGLSAVLERPGFYPSGGGRMRVMIEPPKDGLRPLSLLTRGALVKRQLSVVVAHLPRTIARRELNAFSKALTWPSKDSRVVHTEEAIGPGNVISAYLEFSNVAEMFVGFGERGVLAEQIGHKLAEEVRDYLALEVPVGPHLADQLLLFLSMAQGGCFLTGPLTDHTTTNMQVIQQFLPVRIDVKKVADRRFEVSVSPK